MIFFIPLKIIPVLSPGRTTVRTFMIDNNLHSIYLTCLIKQYAYINLVKSSSQF